jgi:hypothetical protein
MEIKFESSVGEGHQCTKLKAILLEDEVMIKTCWIDFLNHGNDVESHYVLEKKELSDFIGVLLHLQSKLRK